MNATQINKMRNQKEIELYRAIINQDLEKAREIKKELEVIYNQMKEIK